MSRVVTKPFHQDHRHAVHDLAKAEHQLVSAVVWQLDVADDHIVATGAATAAHHQHRFVAFVGRLDNAPVPLKQVVGVFADLVIGIDHQDAFAGQLIVLRCNSSRNGFQWSHTLANLLNRLLDVASVLQNATNPVRYITTVSDVFFHHIDSVVQNFVDRHRDRTVNRIATLLRRIGFLCDKQLQRVERERNIASKDLQELQIAVTKSRRLGTLHIDCPKNLVVQDQWHRQRAS